MSIKDLFNNPGVPKIQKPATSDELVANVESESYVEAKRKEFEQFIPPINFASASTFAKFGSAELYYEKAFERIQQYYPYDGTLAEKTEFHNSSSYLDKHIFDNLYPRTNGYMNFNGTNQYIEVFGGPHTASSGMIGKTLDSTFDNSMVYSAADKRTSAFEFRGEDGVTVEFWMKAPAAANRAIMQVTGALAGEIKLEMDATDRLRLTVGSGNVAPLATATVLENVIAGAANTWNHYAVTIQSSSTGLTYKGYKNGQLGKTTIVGSNLPSILPTTNGLNMTIAANSAGTGNLFTGSLDEFRYWKKAKTEEEIFNNWFIPVGGGTNKHDSNITLGLYFKFNEGITTNTALDQTVLDYSGRINNGQVKNYLVSMRNTGSAIREKLNESEFLDPIIYSTHPDVVAKKAEYKLSGSLADHENPSMLIKYFPAWMQEEDEQSGKQLKYLAQVLGSYFDTLWHQIDFVNKIRDNHYVSGSNKALPFARQLLYDRGFVVPDLFVDATITENLLDKDDNEVYAKQINEVRNTIYHNIYSNLNGIYKSKGTEKAFRNFFRSLGIGEEVVKLRMYADDSTFVLRNNYENKSFGRKYLNFNYEGHFDASLYQTSSTNNSNTFIPGDTNYSGSFTLETEIILPRKNRQNEVGFLPYNNLSASIFGFHTSGSTPSGYTHLATDRDLSVYVIKEKLDTSLNSSDSHKVRFLLTGSNTAVADFSITSPTYNFQYENNKWNLAVRLRHENYPFANVTGNMNINYVAEFYGVEVDANTKRNSFYGTSTIPANYFTDNKIFYAGANRTNFSGSSVCDTDIKLGFVRYWHSYLSNDAIDQHAYDSETFGANEPFENDLVNTYIEEIPREKTLSFHWAFNDLTTSDGSGEILVSDLSSGSTTSDYGSLSNTIQRYVQGKAIGFNANATNALDKVYLQTSRKRLPDDLMSSDLTTIKSEASEMFFVDDDVSDNFYSFEKSLYGTISDEMMNMFSTALDLNNLIGQPNQKYHHRYNMADFLRDRFYDDIENEPDIEKFTSFYKWIDDSISIALQQLTPASARFSQKINNVIESHVLERNKYVHQIPILTTFQSTEGSIKGIAEMKYDWKNGHAPFFPEEEQTHALWQRERKKKDGLRETLRAAKVNHSIQSSGLLRREIDGSTRISDVYAVRKFAKTYDLGLVSQPSIHGGVNFGKRKNLQLFHEVLSPGGALGATSGVPQNIITVGVGDNDGLIRTARDDDNPPRKKKFNANALVGKLDGTEYGNTIQANSILPLNLMSGTVHSGFNTVVKSNFAADVVLSNLHHDSVGNYNETSIQGPFTEAHIGGLQYRHIDINKYDTSKTVSFKIASGGTFPSGSIQFTNSVLSAKLNLGTGSFVTVRDGDGTTVTALYSNVYDLYDNQWTNMDELIFILNNKLDITTNKISNSFLALTQSVTGNFYNYAIQSSSHGFITASGFVGGSPITFSTVSRKLDGRANRPEGWGLVFKDHPSQGDSDGAFGFVGADYSTPYPSPVKLKATRYREETAKRPLNIKNIKTTSSSQKAGNYSNEIQIFSTAPEHQKTWALEANEDANIEILPSFITTPLPHTTHYQSLIGIGPYEPGNIFGAHANNRQLDGQELVAHSNATGSFIVTGSHTAGTKATGAFRYYSTDTQGFQQTADWNGNKIGWHSGISFVLSSAQVTPSDTSTNKYFVTGANSGSSYTNLRTKINSIHSGVYASSYHEIIPPTTSSLVFNGSYATSPNPYLTAPTTSGHYNDNDYSWVFNFASETTSSTNDEFFFTTLDSGGSNEAQYLHIKSSGELEYTVKFSSGASRTWSTGSFKSVLTPRSMNNLILVHSYPGGAPSASDAKILLNGQELTLTFTAAGGAVGNAQALKVPSDGQLYLFTGKGGNNTNLVGTASVAAYFDDALGTQNRQYVYNQGYYKNYGKVRNVSSNLVTQWNMFPPANPVTNGNIFLAYTGSQMINLTASTAGSSQMTTGIGGLAEEPYAVFQITASATGSTYNGTITRTLAVSSHNYFEGIEDLQGGTNQQGLIATNKIVIGSKNFIVAASHTADSDPNYYVAYTASSATIWGILQSKIIANTNVTSINRVDNGVISSLFRLTSSVGSGGNQVVQAPSGISPASFTSPFGMSGGVSQVLALPDNTIARPRTDLLGSERNINTRFSAPGGPEIQTISYLDAYSSTYSVHNALPFRNLSVLGSGSGESGTIRVEDHLGKRRGLKALRALHMGRFGIDSEYGTVTSAGYPTNGSFNKQHRNRHRAYQYSSGQLIITGSNYDNAHINSPIPRSEFQYSWIRSAISGSNWLVDQPVLGYAPRDGIVSASLGYAEALVFPTGSTIYGG